MRSSSSSPIHRRYGLWLTVGAVLAILLAIALALALVVREDLHSAIHASPDTR